MVIFEGNVSIVLPSSRSRSHIPKTVCHSPNVPLFIDDLRCTSRQSQGH